MSEISTSINSLGELTELALQKKSVISAYMDNLPERALSLGIRVVLALIFLFLGRILINWIRKACRKALNTARIDKGVIQFLDSFLSIILWVVLIMTIAVNNGIDATSVVAILGSAGLAIGLSLQGALSNFAGGVLILLLAPFKVGDYIIENASGMEGRVSEINVFYTHLITVDHRLVVVPNGKLADTSLVNVTSLGKRRLQVTVSIAYGADLKKAKELLEKLAGSLESMPEEPITVFVDSLGDSGVQLGVRIWVKADDYWQTKWDLTENIKLTFDKEGIEIPFSQLDVHMK